MSPREPENTAAAALRALEPVIWILQGDYPEPSAEMKPFVFALMNRALNGDGDAVATLRKLFPPRPSGTKPGQAK